MPFKCLKSHQKIPIFLKKLNICRNHMLIQTTYKYKAILKHFFLNSNIILFSFPKLQIVCLHANYISTLKKQLKHQNTKNFF